MNPLTELTIARNCFTELSLAIKCDKCSQVLATKTLSQGFVLSQSTFHLVLNAMIIFS